MIFATKKNLGGVMTPRRIRWFLSLQDVLLTTTAHIAPVRRKYSRHIDIRRHYIRELFLGNLVKLVPLRTNLIVVDALTKSLPTPGLERHRRVTLISKCVFCTRSEVADQFFWLINSAFFTWLFRMGESDYLNDNTRS